MIIIGIDAHKQVHAAHAIDEAGHELANWRGDNSPAGWLQLHAWLKAFDAPCQVGIEGAWGYGRGLAQFLLDVDQALPVYDINPRWTAQARRGARRQHKTDRLDARAVALIVRQDAPDLPRVTADDEASVLSLLVRERDAAVADATTLRNRLHALLLLVDPLYQQRFPALTAPRHLQPLLVLKPSSGDHLACERATQVRQLAARLMLTLEHAIDLKARIEALALEHFAPLTDIHGVAPLTAGVLAAHLGPGRRFRSDAHLAAFAGVSPLETSSAGSVRHRLNRGGNRQLNAVLYRICLTQLRSSPTARAYVDRRRSEGRTLREAMRALKRYIARAIFQRWSTCQSQKEKLSVPVQAPACT